MRSCASNTFELLERRAERRQAVAVVSEPHRCPSRSRPGAAGPSARAERLVDDLRLRQPLERQADLHRAAGHGECRASSGSSAPRSAATRSSAAAIGTCTRRWISANRSRSSGWRIDVRPELEEHRQPAVVAIDRAARVGRDAVESRRRRQPRTARPSAPPRPRHAARRRRRTGPPWRRSWSRPRPSCSPPPPRSGRARWRGSRRPRTARSAAAIRSSRVCSRRSVRVRRLVAIPSVF